VPHTVATAYGLDVSAVILFTDKEQIEVREQVRVIWREEMQPRLRHIPRRRGI
jgi:hypothetical protein